MNVLVTCPISAARRCVTSGRSPSHRPDAQIPAAARQPGLQL